MGNHSSADARRNVLEQLAQINRGLDALEQALSQLIRERGAANTPSAPRIMLICTVIGIIRPNLISEMGRQEIDPSLRLAFAVIAVALGCVSCSLLMCVLLSDLPWPNFIACLLMLVVPFVFIAS